MNASLNNATAEPVSKGAPKTARQGLQELITWALDNRYCSTADTIRALLLSLYNGSENKCDLAGVQLLDATQRRALVAVILGIGRDGAGNFYDYEIRDTFCVLGGERGLRWFLEANGNKLEADLVQHFMTGARRLAERTVAA